MNYYLGMRILFAVGFFQFWFYTIFAQAEILIKEATKDENFHEVR